MLRVVLLLSVLLCPLVADAWRGRVMKLGKGHRVRQVCYRLMLGKHYVDGCSYSSQKGWHLPK